MYRPSSCSSRCLAGFDFVYHKSGHNMKFELMGLRSGEWCFMFRKNCKALLGHNPKQGSQALVRDTLRRHGY